MFTILEKKKKTSIFTMITKALCFEKTNYYYQNQPIQSKCTPVSKETPIRHVTFNMNRRKLYVSKRGGFDVAVNM